MAGVCRLYEKVEAGDLSFVEEQTCANVSPETLFFIADLNGHEEVLDKLNEIYGKEARPETLRIYEHAADSLKKRRGRPSRTAKEHLDQAMHEAVRHNDGEVLRLILESGRVKPDRKSLDMALNLPEPNYVLVTLLETDDYTEENMDGMKINAKVIAKLIEQGKSRYLSTVLEDASLNFPADNDDITTAMMEAINKAGDSVKDQKYLDTLRILLDKEMLVADQTMGGIENYPMQSATSRYYKKLMSLLMEYGGTDEGIEPRDWVRTMNKIVPKKVEDLY